MKAGILILTFLVSFDAYSSSFQSQCYKFEESIPVNFCVHTPKYRPSRDIVYYLHGAFLSEESWQDEYYYTSQLRTEWETQSAPLPTVVSVSYGPLWILAQKNPSPTSGLLENFAGEIIPRIEKQLGGLRGRRIVYGESMGGYNTIQLALKTKLFAKAGILCSPMAEVSPFASDQEIEEALKKTMAWQYYKESGPNVILDSVKQVISLVQIFYPTQKDWETGDPLKLADQRRTDYPKLYVAAGSYDKFAVYEGNTKFVSILKKHGINLEWRPLWGGHCAVDIPSLARFLVE